MTKLKDAREIYIADNCEMRHRHEHVLNFGMQTNERPQITLFMSFKHSFLIDEPRGLHVIKTIRLKLI